MFNHHDLEYVCHLAAQPSNWYSRDETTDHQKNNIEGFVNIIDNASRKEVKNFVYASSSSVYGSSDSPPFTERSIQDRPDSFFGATKRSNEIMAHTYNKTHQLSSVGLRIFPAYGPFDRPDSLMFSYVQRMQQEKEIEVLNFGNMRFDLVYVDDIVKGILAAIDSKFEYEIFNLGRNDPISLSDLISLIEEELDVVSNKKLLPLPKGEIKSSYANIDKAKRMLGYDPKTPVQEGVKKFISWYLEYYKQ